MEFVNLMNYREMKSLVTQLAFCYGINRRVSNPFNYFLCSYKDEVKFEFEKMGSKFWYVNLIENNFYENQQLMEDKDKFIYLSPDSPNLLENISEENVYIIGGFVDKPVSKNRTLFKANLLNIKTARLPLDEHVKDLKNNVLNVNTVVEIIAEYYETKDWKKSIEKALPKRMVV